MNVVVRFIRPRYRTLLYYFSWFVPAVLALVFPSGQPVVILVTVIAGAAIDRIVLLGLPDEPGFRRRRDEALSITLDAMLSGLRVGVAELFSAASKILRNENIESIIANLVVVALVMAGMFVLLSEVSTLSLVGPFERVRQYEKEFGLDRKRERAKKSRNRQASHRRYLTQV